MISPTWKEILDPDWQAEELVRPPEPEPCPDCNGSGFTGGRPGFIGGQIECYCRRPFSIASLTRRKPDQTLITSINPQAYEVPDKFIEQVKTDFQNSL